ncbi:MAG: ProQ/FinO family protein [Burkholderiaceae bacterium]
MTDTTPSAEPTPADAAAPGAAPATGTAPAPSGKAAAAAAPRIHPYLDQLAGFYPHLFGQEFRPLKRGVFEELLAAHAGVFEKEGLKEALSQHTRSTRYLTGVASGQQRHGLDGKPVEAMAPEHVHHALLEVFRRRQRRTKDDLRPQLRERIVRAFEASGLERGDYAMLVRGRDEAANTLLDEALEEAARRSAKDEALRRAFEASGKTIEEFADMYGMKPEEARRTLGRGRKAVSAG